MNHKMLLTDFDDLVLSHIFDYLQLNDLISSSETCRRFKAISETKFKKYTTFNLCYYLWHREDTGYQVDYIEKVLSIIGKHISVLVVHGDADYRYMRYEIERYCTNVKSLVWGQRASGEPKDEHKHTFLTWIQNLKLESLTLLDDTSLKSKLFHGITTLKELKMNFHFSNDSLVTELYHIIEQNANIETLYIQLTYNFNFEVFGKLKNLRHLGIGVTDPQDIVKITPFLKMHGVTKLHIKILFEHYEDTSDEDELLDDFEEVPSELNQSLKRLAETSTLKELSLIPLCFVYYDLYTSTIRALHFFELKSLRLQIFLDNDRPYEIIANVQPNLTKLDLYFWNDDMQLDATVFIIKNLKKLEMFRVNLCDTAIKEFLDDILFMGILQESTERPTLTVKFRDRDRYENVAVKVNRFQN